MVHRLVSLAVFFVSGLSFIQAQSISDPNSALKSHETLNILKIVTSEEKTEIFLEVENRIPGGNFCADKKIYIKFPDGTKSDLISSRGIPVCPDTYGFKTIGEKLDFILTFRPLKQGVESIDLVEDCSENCFSFYGIILDNDLNKQIDGAFLLAETGEPANALVSFIKIEGETGHKNKGAEALLCLNIIKLSKAAGNNVKASEWYKKLESSGLPDVRLYLKHLNAFGIKY